MKLMKTALLAATMASLSAPAAFASAETEAYVQENASAALASLNDPAMTDAERRETFHTLMTRFTDIEAIALRSIGKYRTRFTAAEQAAFVEAFRHYAIATYAAELDKYRGNSIKVKSSSDARPNSVTKVDSSVTTVIDLPDPKKDVEVIWRVVEFAPGSNSHTMFGGGYKVIDVAIVTEGGTIKLGQQQQKQFQSILDKNNGDAQALIKRINELTAELNAKVKSGNS